MHPVPRDQPSRRLLKRRAVTRNLRSGQFASGDTTLDGGIGNDTFNLNYGARSFLVGGSGNDTFRATALTWLENHFDGGSDFDTILANANGSRLGISSITGIEEIASAGFANFTIELQLNTSGGPSAPIIDLSKTLLSGVASIEGTSQGDIIYLAGAFAGDSVSQTSNDTVNADYGNDSVYTGFGNDVLYREDGNDLLSGGSGNDALTGGAGADTFIFSVDSDQDTITDFVAGTDKVQLEDLIGFDDFADVQAVMTMSGANTIVDFGNGDVLQFVNVASSSLTAVDFIFA
ncbi:calcium-binding protein [Neorhizobium galegae]|uniref:calcium-binding protein n=1 Tax=Neorhizobium galegae TaxID=399 RepID=UPI00351D3268